MSSTTTPIRISASRLKAKNNLPTMTQGRGRSGVSEGMLIYLLTNTVNGKRYVGRTTRSSPTKRWNEHRSAGRKPGAKTVISRAMFKHGVEAFTFEVLERVESRDQLPEREGHYIRFYDSLVPNGYNVESYSPETVISAGTRLKASISFQGRQKTASNSKTSRYVGVYRRPDGAWAALITQRGKDRERCFRDETKAAHAYDMMALHLYGPNARTNFSPTIYSTTDIEETIRLFQPIVKTSVYHHVDFIPSRQRWRGCVRLLDGTTRVRVAVSEIEAAEFVDAARVVLMGVKTSESLNFPEKLPRYLSLDAAWLDRKAVYGSRGGGVSKNKGRYVVRLGRSGKHRFGSYSTYEEALAVAEQKRKELGVVWDL